MITATAANQPDSEIRRRTQAGDIEAAYQMGRFYVNRNDWANAVPWYRQAAERGHPKAQNNLGIAYLKGLGIEQNLAEACRLMEAAQNSMPTRNGLENVALCNDKLHNYEKAFTHYLAAARQGSAPAMRLTGQMYKSGDGTPQKP